MARAARDEDRVRVRKHRSDDRPAGREPAAGGQEVPASGAGRAPDRGDAPPREPADAASGSPPRISAPDAARAGLRQIVELTAKEPEGVTAVRRAENGWVVSVEVLVERRIPSSADLLALYEAELDPDGALTSYRRRRRYSRGRGGDEEDS